MNLQAAIDCLKDYLDYEMEISDKEYPSFKEIRQAITILEIADKILWLGNAPLLQRFDEAVEDTVRAAKIYKNDYIWQERLRAVQFARALLEALPNQEQKFDVDGEKLNRAEILKLPIEKRREILEKQMESYLEALPEDK
jgi:hypothetical protein